VKLIAVHPDEVQISPELSRSGSAKQFEERLKSSIEEIGLAEPIKVAPLPEGGYLVIDGMMRLRAVRTIREKQPERFQTVAVYVLDYKRRFEIRYQSDIYQDLLPSQLAVLVEHLHSAEHVRKIDIARYIGVSPATLRNYTGLWRLMQRGALFAKIVDLMDLQVIPSSNPYAWLRLTSAGLRKVIEDNLSEGEPAEPWIEQTATRARQGSKQRFPIKFVEAITDVLPPEYYRVGEEVRIVKRDLGQRKGGTAPALKPVIDCSDAFKHLSTVSQRSHDLVLRTAAKSLQEYLQ
jgi:ParB-like nuclease domain